MARIRRVRQRNRHGGIRQRHSRVAEIPQRAGQLGDPRGDGAGPAAGSFPGARGAGRPVVAGDWPERRSGTAGRSRFDQRVGPSFSKHRDAGPPPGHRRGQLHEGAGRRLLHPRRRVRAPGGDPRERGGVRGVQGGLRQVRVPVAQRPQRHLGGVHRDQRRGRRRSRVGRLQRRDRQVQGGAGGDRAPDDQRGDWLDPNRRQADEAGARHVGHQVGVSVHALPQQQGGQLHVRALRVHGARRRGAGQGPDRRQQGAGRRRPQRAAVRDDGLHARFAKAAG